MYLLRSLIIIREAASGYPDVDISITTRELARMIESAGIYLKHLPDEEFYNPFGESTGAATIFGATGGVMEAALRTAVKLITGAEAPSPEFNDVRGMKNICLLYTSSRRICITRRESFVVCL